MTPAEDDLLRWFHGPNPGPYEYLRGDLAMMPLDARPPVAALALRMATKERPELVIAQRRHGEHDYSYLAWKARG